MKTVLIAEDEASIRDFVVINLKRNGYEVFEAANGQEAIDKFDNADSEIDIAILDIMMPVTDGLEVCKHIRDKSKRIGIIMLTAKTQEMDKVTGLLVGADDYITKPFSPSELMARVDAIYRRVSITSNLIDNREQDKDSIIILAEYNLNLRNHTLTKNNEPIELTQVEFQIMEYFFTNPNAALSRSDIMKTVWGNDFPGDDKIVDVNIHRLRNKVEDDPSSPKHLMTIWGMGYKWIE